MIRSIFGRIEPRSAERLRIAGGWPRSGILQWRDRLFWLRHHMHYLKLLWYAVAREVRSCYRNIELLRATKPHLQGMLGAGLAGFRDGNPLSDTYCRGCIEDMRRVVAKFPWASTVECQMILAGWELGEKRSRHNLECDSEQHIPAAL